MFPARTECVFLRRVQPVSLMELLAGVRAEVGQSVSAYQRGVAGEASPADLEAALQLVYQLFVTAPRPDHPEELDTVMRMTREAVSSTAFSPPGHRSMWCDCQKGGKGRV